VKTRLLIFLVAALTVVSLVAVGCSAPATPDEGTVPEQSDSEETGTPAAPEGKTFNWVRLFRHTTS